MSEVTIIEEPTGFDSSPSQDRRDLAEEIKLLETALFSKKERLSKMPHLHGGKIVLKAPSMFRCQSCGNDECLDRETTYATVIANVTAAHGCLDWLPPKNGVL